MNRFLLATAATAALVLTSLTAQAQPLQPGPYLGLNIGVSADEWKRHNGIYDCCGDLLNDKTSNEGFAGGAQVGFNWVMPGWMFGVEGDFDGATNYKQRLGAATSAFDSTSEASFRSPWLATIRGRLGWELPWATFYGTGGFAFGETNYEINDHDGSFTKVKTQTGWTIGAGAEAPISNEVSLKIEYLYVDLGNDTFSPTGSVGLVSGYLTQVHTTENEVRVGFNWHL